MDGAYQDGEEGRARADKVTERGRKNKRNRKKRNIREAVLSETESVLS